MYTSISSRLSLDLYYSIFKYTQRHDRQYKTALVSFCIILYDNDDDNDFLARAAVIHFSLTRVPVSVRARLYYFVGFKF